MAELDQVLVRLEELARRVERLERRLGTEAGAGSSPAPVEEGLLAAPERTGATLVVSEPPAGAPPRTPASVPTLERLRARRALATGGSSPAFPPRAAAQRRSVDLERLIGGRWYAVIGAIVVVVGMAMFFKWAYDQGWFRLPPAGKCGLGAFFGVALLVAGEWAQRRKYHAPAAGLSAAGVGTLYAAVYAAHALFGLIGAGSAFVGLAGAAAVGIVVSLRSGRAGVGVLSLAGAYLTPLLLEGGDPHPVVLPSYLLSLLAVGLVLSAKRSGFAVMRTAAWWGTMLLGGAWAAGSASDTPLLSLAFVAIAWASMHGELAFSASRGRLADSVRRRGWSVSRPYAVSFSTSLWATLLGVWTLRAWGQAPVWMAPAAGMVVTAVLAHVFAGATIVLRERPRGGLERLGASLAVQSGALLIATIAMAVSGWPQSLAWLALAVAAVGAGRWINARSLDVYGVCVLVIGTVRLLGFDWWLGTTASRGSMTLGLYVTPWMALVLGAAGAWLAIARLLLAGPVPRVREAPLAAAVGVLVAGAAFVHPESDPVAICLAWLVLAVVVGAARRVEHRLWLDGLAAAFVPAAILPWAAAYPFHRWDGAWAVGLHPGLWQAGLIAAVTVGLAAWVSRGPHRGSGAAAGLRIAAAAIGTLLMFGATTLEVVRAAGVLWPDRLSQQAAVSIWWGLFAIGLLAAGFWRRAPVARHAGLVLLGIATLKAVVFDLAEVSQGARVASFLGLGLLMLAVATVYAKLSAALKPPEQPEPESV